MDTFYCDREEDLRDANGLYSICGVYCAEGRVAKQKNFRAVKQQSKLTSDED